MLPAYAEFSINGSELRFGFHYSPAGFAAMIGSIFVYGAMGVYCLTSNIGLAALAIFFGLGIIFSLVIGFVEFWQVWSCVVRAKHVTVTRNGREMASFVACDGVRIRVMPVEIYLHRGLLSRKWRGVCAAIVDDHRQHIVWLAVDKQPERLRAWLRNVPLPIEERPDDLAMTWMR